MLNRIEMRQRLSHIVVFTNEDENLVADLYALREFLRERKLGLSNGEHHMQIYRDGEIVAHSLIL